MQSLCLDVKVLDENQEEIDLPQNFDDEDPMPSRSYDDEDTVDSSDFNEDDLGDAGYGIEGEDEDGDLDMVDGEDDFSFDEDEDDLGLGEDDDVLDLGDDDGDGFSFDDED